MLRFKKEDGSFYPDWKVERLEKLSERVIVGLATSVTPYYRESGVPLIRNMNIKKNYLDDSDMLFLDEEYAKKQTGKKIKKDDVLTVHTGSNIGLTCLAPKKYEGALSFTTLITTTKSEVLNSEFLCQFMNSNIGINRLNILTTSGGKPNLNAGDLINLKVPVPHIDEQNKIAESLSMIDNKINNQKTIVDNFVKLKRGIIQKVFSREIRFKDDYGNEFPEWESTILGNVVETFISGSTPSRTEEKYWNGDIPWLSSGELNYGMVENTIEKITIEGKNSAHLKLHPVGTFIIAITGLEAAGTRGNCGFLGVEATTNQSCMAIYPNKERLDSNFLFQWYLKVGEEYGLKYTQGTKQQSYNLDILKNLPIEVPCLKEQKKIANCLFTLDEKIEAEKKVLEDWKQLKKALLQQMFV